MWLDSGIHSLKKMLNEHVFSDLAASPLLPFLGTTTFIVVTGYYWRKQCRSGANPEPQIIGPHRKTRRRKTLLLTPITLAEIPPNERKRNIVVLGLAGAGKTAFLNKLLHFSTSYIDKDPEPTMGVKMTSVDLNGLIQTYYEVGGGENTRMFAKEFIHMANLVIFVVDASSSNECLQEAKEFFHVISKEKGYYGPVIVVAGKQDLPNARTVLQIYDILGVLPSDDVYVLPAYSAPKSREKDGDHLAVIDGETTIVEDRNDNNHHDFIENILFRTFI